MNYSQNAVWCFHLIREACKLFRGHKVLFLHSPTKSGAVHGLLTTYLSYTPLRQLASWVISGPFKWINSDPPPGQFSTSVIRHRVQILQTSAFRRATLTDFKDPFHPKMCLSVTVCLLKCVAWTILILICLMCVTIEVFREVYATA